MQEELLEILRCPQTGSRLSLQEPVREGGRVRHGWLVAQETVIADRPAEFGGYRPKNFDLDYQGDVSIRTALQLSLNIPAVKVLDEVGPARLAVRLRRAGVALASRVPLVPGGGVNPSTTW